VVVYGEGEEAVAELLRGDKVRRDGSKGEEGVLKCGGRV
jgi:hypothetical protein